jgi:hypothetical protein
MTAALEDILASINDDLAKCLLEFNDGKSEKLLSYPFSQQINQLLSYKTIHPELSSRFDTTIETLNALQEIVSDMQKRAISNKFG